MRIALGIEYDGTAYNGWQKQQSGTGIQELLERALASVADEAVETVCAGRTDAGVHASAQVVHFDSTAGRTGRNWVLGVNSNLPADINALWATPVDDDFHARYSATARTYRYLILNRLTRSALHRHRAWWLHRPLHERPMRLAAEFLVGEHDFSAFRAAGCQAPTPRRRVISVAVERHGDWLAITVKANAFLQHMVRNIVGLLAAVGSGDASPASVEAVLASRDRTQGGVTAPPHGLALVGVEYPERFGLPAANPSTPLPF